MSFPDKTRLRQVPGWGNAPVPICMGGDFRALTFCCKPGMPLTFIAKCRRDQSLKEIGLSPQKFLEIKDAFSKKVNWNDPIPCFGSLSYCCMRAGGCPRRDTALLAKYPELAENGSGELKMGPKIMAKYFSTKRQLAKEILRHAKNQAKVKDLLTFDP